MGRKIVLMAALSLLFLAMMATQAIMLVRADDSTAEPPALPRVPGCPKWFVDANGTVFQVTSSGYLNATLTSSEYVYVCLESVPRVICYSIESLSSANSTVLTLSGFVPSTTYFRHQDGYLIEEFATDSNGGYVYTQDISVPHHVYILEHSSTLYISSNYTFASDIYENIVVAADNIVIDGNGHTLQAPAPEGGFGFYLSGRSGVIIKNVVVKGWTFGIFLYGSSGNTISGNTLTNNQYGIWSYGSVGNTISGNALTTNQCGIDLDRSGGNVLRNNIMTGNLYSFGVAGQLLSEYIQDVDTSNIVDGKPIYYWISRQNEEVPLDAGYVGLVNSINITVKRLELKNNIQGVLLAYTTESEIIDNTVTNNQYGIYLYGSDGNTISDNTLTTNQCGIDLVGSGGNTVSGNNITNNIATNPYAQGIDLVWSSGNTISDNSITKTRFGIYLYEYGGNTFSGNNITTNWFGIWLVRSSGNTFYHNNIANSNNAYDGTAANYWYSPDLLEGNYWSNYPGTDDGSGTGKHAIAGDGIGDTDIPWPGPNFDYYPFVHESGWIKIIQHQITIDQSGAGSDFTGTLVVIDGVNYGVSDLPINFLWDEGSTHTFAYQSPLVVTPNVKQCVWTSTIGLSTQQSETITISASGNIVGNYKTQYYLTVISLYDMPCGEGWYDEGETAYATLQVGLDYVDTEAHGFVGWSGDASGLDLISEPIMMDAPKTAIANWEASPVYGDVRTIGFWKHQVNVWYFTELAKTGVMIRGIGTAQISQGELIAYLTFVDSNSGYFRGEIVGATNLDTLRNAYNILKTPTGPNTMKMRAAQQLLALWLNFARKAFFWNTELSQDTVYVYYQYNFENEYGLTTIGEAIKFAETELLKPDGNYEAAKNVCDSINNNLGIVWGT